MVNSTDFGHRLQKIMNHYAISASSFADYMGVGRSSISHILSGRNKPSLDFVMKIVEAYKEVDLEWLLYGKGAFPKTDTPSLSTPHVAPKENNIEIKAEIPQDLFTQNPTQEIKNNPNIPLEEKEPLKMPTSDQKIDRIVFFYTDGTFSSYQMKKT